jgi:hypothetical protein
MLEQSLPMASIIETNLNSPLNQVERKESNTSTTSSAYSGLSASSSKTYCKCQQVDEDLTSNNLMQKEKNKYLQIPAHQSPVTIKANKFIKKWLLTNKSVKKRYKHKPLSNTITHSKSTPDFHLNDEFKTYACFNDPCSNTVKYLCGSIEAESITTRNNNNSKVTQSNSNLPLECCNKSKTRAPQGLVQSSLVRQTSVSCDLIHNSLNEANNSINKANKIRPICSTCNQLLYCSMHSITSLPEYPRIINQDIGGTTSGCDLVQNLYTNAINNETLVINDNNNTSKPNRKIPKYTTKLTSRLSKLLKIKQQDGNHDAYDCDDNNSLHVTATTYLNECYFSNDDANLKNNSNRLRIKSNKKMKKTYKSTSELDNFIMKNYYQNHQDELQPDAKATLHDDVTANNKNAKTRAAIMYVCFICLFS